MLAEPFEHRTCAAFEDQLPLLPNTALEGDAHLEQFSVTTGSFGFDDFDRAGFGPAVVDLVRYGSSLHLTCAQVWFTCDPDAAVERFLDSYRSALVATPKVREPAVVKRLRSRASRSRAAWLDGIQQSFVALDPGAEKELRGTWEAYIRQVGTPSREMSIVAIGRAHDGVGSATAYRALIRIAGPTPDPDDDLLVEIREGIQYATPSCVWRGPPNATIVLWAMSMLRREMPALRGFVLGPRTVWLQSWEPSHVELSVAELNSEAELDGLIADAAGQLAGQAWPVDSGRTGYRKAQIDALDRNRARIATTARALAREVETAWKRFGR